MCRIESHFCERGQCLTVGNQRAQCNSRLISAILPKSCCDTNRHPPGQTLLQLEESVEKMPCGTERTTFITGKHSGYCCGIANCLLSFLCASSLVHM